jgi:class 3 adenylate cyclase
MQCANCATFNALLSKFCTNCGVALDIVCTACGRGCHPAARFCGWCGAPRTVPLPTVEAHGERKQATVLFADIVGSTEMIAGLDAEDAAGRLRPVVEAMAQAVRRFDGTILGRLGDGVNAIFGAPRAQEGHALMACQAALAMQEAMATQPNPIRIRVGLHSGEVVAGAINAGSSQERQAAGVTVHIASRIEQAAEPGGILLSAACRELAGQYCDTRSAGTRALKGIPGPVEVFRLLGLKHGVASDRFRDESLSQLRGREKELGILKQALLDAERRAGSAIGVVAAPGIGKSRLCYEFSEWCRERRVDVFEARAHIFGKATPLLPVLELMRALFRIAPLTEAATARRQIAEKLLALGPSFAEDPPLMADLLGFPAPELVGQNIDPKARQRRLLSIAHAMVKEVGRRTSVIVFEDLHWLDEPSQDFLETIVKAASGTNFVVVLNYRPSWPCPWLALPHYRQLPLAELASGDIDGLVRDLTGDDPMMEKVITHVARQSDGNPFFAEELVRALARSGVLTGKRGHYRQASSEWHEPVLPPSIEAAIGARLDILPGREKMLLQVGAVIGKEYPAALARKVAGISEGEARELFGHLCDLDLIKATTTVHGPGFAFRHPLFQEVGYAMQLRSRRIALHAAVADAIAQSDWGYRDEFAGLLSHHYEAAGKMTAAARQLIRLATWIGRTNVGEAFRQAKKARQLLGSQAAPKDVEMMRAVASASVLTFGWRVGIRVDEADPHAEEALRYARKFADDETGPELLMHYGRFKAQIGSADAYAALMEEALATPTTDLGRTATFQGCLAQAHWMSGFLLKAEAACDAALKLLAIRQQQGVNGIVGLDSRPYTSFDVELWINCMKARILVWLGRLREANILLGEVSRAEGTNRETPVVQYIAYLASVELACYRNDPVAAHQHAQRLRIYADQSDIPYLHVYALFATARAKTCSGACADAVCDLRASLEFAAAVNAGREHQSHLLAELSYAQYGSGRFNEAAETARTAIDIARDRRHRTAECLACMVHGAGIAVSKGAVARAHQHLGWAEDLICQTGAVLLESRLETLRSDMQARLH